MSKNRLSALKGASIASFLVALPIATFASCAATENAPTDPPDASVRFDAALDADAAPEAGCESTQTGCPLTCADVPWCPVAVELSPYTTLMAVWGSSKDDVWAVGSDAAVIHWDGKAWTSIPFSSPITNTFNTVWGSGPNDVWLASSTDAVFHAKGFAGATTKLDRIDTPLPYDLHVPVRRIWGTSATQFVLATHRYELPVGDDLVTGNMLRRGAPDSGATEWSPVPGTEHVLAVWGTSFDDIWISADGSSHDTGWKVAMTYHGKTGVDGQLEWTDVDSRSRAPLRALWGSSAKDIWAVGDVGVIRRVTDTTQSEWMIIDSPTREDLHGLWGSAADDIWAVGAAGTILHYDGKVWSEVLAAFPSADRPDLHGVWGSARNDVWIVGDGIVLHYDGRTLETNAPDAGGGR